MVSVRLYLEVGRLTLTHRPLIAPHRSVGRRSVRWSRSVIGAASRGSRRPPSASPSPADVARKQQHITFVMEADGVFVPVHHITIIYITLPYLTLPYLTLPYLTLPYLTIICISYV